MLLVRSVALACHACIHTCICISIFSKSLGNEDANGEKDFETCGGRKEKEGKHTLSAPTSPKTLNRFAKCRYHPKLLARWYGSSGSWAKKSAERILLLKVARATINVIVLIFKLAVCT